MKTASMVLGIVGGALSLLGAVYLAVFGTMIFSTLENMTGSLNVGERVFDIVKTIYTIMSIPMGIGGILGLIGGIIVKKKNTAGGVLMIIGTVLTFSMLMLLGAIFAFVKEKQPVYPQYAPYPPYPQYPGPQNPAYPNPPQDKQQQ
jgi:hypothetical protein